MNLKHTVWSGKQLYHYACRKIKHHAGAYLPQAETAIHTTIIKKRSRAWKSYCIDYALEGILNMGYYTEKHMLIVHDPYCNAPLTAMCLFSTKEECRVRVSVQDEFGWEFTSEASKKHRLPIFCLRAGQKNKILVETYNGEEKIHEETVVLFTKPLPNYLKNMIVVKKKKKESGLPLVFVYGGDTRFPYAFDENGEIRYYMSEPPKAYGLFPMSSGRFLFLVHNVSAPAFANPHSVLACEMDLFGRTHREYLVEDGIHHDGCEMSPGGNILTVSSSMEKYVEDAIIEIERTTGEVVRRLCLADVLSEHPYFDMFDWAHINTVSYLEKEHCILICARNLHSVIKINWDTFELLWIFCDLSFWEGTPYEGKVLRPLGNMQYSYQAHAAYMMGEQTEDGKELLLIFDNHWQARRPIPSFDGDKNSYARIYAIDEKEKTVELLQNYKSRKSKIRSNAIALKDSIFVMSGYLNKPVDEFEGIISEHDRKSGKVMNRYMTYNSFYRAYPFFADYREYSKPMETIASVMRAKSDSLPEAGLSGDYLLGIRGTLQPCKPPDLSGVKPMPLIRKRFYRKSGRKEIRKEVKSKMWKAEKPEYELKADLGEIYVRLYDRILLVFNRDHVIEKIFFCGNQHNYVKDFSNTTQRSPQLFAESRYFLAVPVVDLAVDSYEIYFQCRGELYKLGKNIKM